MTRSNLARSLALVAVGLALSLPVAMIPANAQAREHEKRGASAIQHSAEQERQSGAADLLIAYENTLMAHMDATLGHDELAQSHLNVARQHLEHANRLLGGTITSPATPERGGTLRGGGGGAEASEEGRATTRSPESPTAGQDEEARGGGGGPTGGPLSNLEMMMRQTEEDLTAENTNRLVAAFTNELSRLARIGGGGGPGMRGQTIAGRISSLEHLEMAYAAAGKAAGSTAIQDWDEARNSMDDARRHLEHARKAPGNEALKAQLDRAQKALEEAEGPIRSRSAQASEATARAIRELTMAISSLPQGQPEAKPGKATPGGTSR